MRRIAILLGAALIAGMFGCSIPPGNMKDIPASMADHCQTGLKQTANVSFSSATTTSLIAPETGGNIYLCGWDIQIVNNATTAQNFTLEYGTGSTCGTGTTTLANWTGNITASTASPLTMSKANNGYTQMMTSSATTSVPSQRLCGVTTQSSVVDGYITYVQE